MEHVSTKVPLLKEAYGRIVPRQSKMVSNTPYHGIIIIR
jgi:hypothetical protein